MNALRDYKSLKNLLALKKFTKIFTNSPKPKLSKSFHMDPS